MCLTDGKYASIVTKMTTLLTELHFQPHGIFSGFSLLPSYCICPPIADARFEAIERLGSFNSDSVWRVYESVVVRVRDRGSKRRYSFRSQLL